jgi:hypothetical protein
MAIKQLSVWIILGLCLVLGACATPPEPYEYRSSNDIKPGPGLFSGEDGRFTLYGNPEAVREASAPQETDREANVPGQPAEP